MLRGSNPAQGDRYTVVKLFCEHHPKEGHPINTQIVNRRGCSAEEKQHLIQYLKQTPVACVADKIAAGALLSKGEIQSRAVLGSLTTIFGNLGGLLATRRHGKERFLVREVLPVLRDPRCTDKGALRKVECYMELDAANRLEIKITICEVGGGRMIVDGNKRASAIYERRSSSSFTPVMAYLVSR